MLFRSYDFGPISLWVMGAIGLLNAVFVWCFYKELKLVTFDKGLAHALGFSPIFVHYALMGLTSVTAVGAFESVGSVLVVALMITPPATAFLLTTRLSHMIVLSLVLGVLASIGGYAMAYAMDVSIAGAMATVTGLLFLGALFFAPTTGIVSKVLLNKTQRLRFSAQMLMVQLLDHEGKDNEAEENTITNMVHHMGWEERFAKRTARWAVQKRYIVRKNNRLFLTSLGRETAKEVMLNRN